MISVHENYVIDEKGNKKAVLIPLADWERIMEALEELEDIRLYDRAKAESSAPIPFDEAMEQIAKGKSVNL